MKLNKYKKQDTNCKCAVAIAHSNEKQATCKFDEISGVGEISYLHLNGWQNPRARLNDTWVYAVLLKLPRKIVAYLNAFQLHDSFRPGFNVDLR